MTTQDILNEKETLRTEYINRGGIPSMFDQLISNCIQSNEMGLNEDWVETPLSLFNQYFKISYTGRKERFDIREVVGKIANPYGDKTYSFLDKKYI